MNVYGELTRAQLENLTADPTLATATKGRLWMRTDLSSLKVDLGGSADTLALLAATQAFTNKTFSDAANFAQIATPASPSSGFNKIYVKSDGNFYTLNSSGVETQIGSGAGGGSKNYLGTVNNVNGNGNFELGSTSGWSLAHSTLSGLTPTSTASTGTAFDSTHGGTAATALSLQVLSTAALSPTATWVSGNSFITVSSATGIVNGQIVTNPGSGTGFPSAPVFVTNVSGTSVYLNKALSGTQAGASAMLFSATPLAGTYSMAFGTNSQTAAVSSTAGDMVISSAFTIDAEDAAKMMQIKFYYQNQAGTGIQFTGTSTGTFAVWVYDVTNAAWIQPAGVYNLTQGSGVGICTATFQTTSNGTKYQLALINQLGLVGVSYNLWLDDMSVSPVVVPQGYAGDDWVAYTPTFTGFGTPTNISFFSRRLGDSLQVMGKFTTGTATATEARISLGYSAANSNVTVDSTKVASIREVGTWVLGTTSATSSKATLAEAGVSYLTFGINAGAVAELTKAQGTTFGNTTDVAIMATIPITGWSSNVSFSNDTDTRVVAMNASGSPANVSANNPIIFPTVNKDTHGAYSSTTGRYTVPVSGWYSVSASETDGSATNGNLYVAVNTVQFGGRLGFHASGVAAAQGTQVVFANAGDLIDVRPDIALASFGGSCGLSISRLSGPASIAVSETVAFSGENTAGTTIFADAKVPFATTKYDTHGGWSVDTYTVPISGKYRITANFMTAAVTLSTTQVIQLGFKQNSNEEFVQQTFGNGANHAIWVSGSKTYRCLAGDTLQVFLATGVSTTLDTNAGRNYVCIERIGNY